MSRPIRHVYRIVVTKWPTEDGRPWPRWIEPNEDHTGWIARPYHGAPQSTPLPWLAWMHPQGGIPDELEHRARYGEAYVGDGDLYGFLMPPTTKRYYLSRAAAERWCMEARLLGAECHIETGRVEWEPLP